jgi:hypothetical protein
MMGLFLQALDITQDLHTYILLIKLSQDVSLLTRTEFIYAGKIRTAGNREKMAAKMG